MWLQIRWSLHYGADSKKLLVVSGYDLASLDVALLDSWELETASKCLGQWLQNDGGIAMDVKDVQHKMWRAFHANLDRD